MPDKIEKRAIIDVRFETEKARKAAIELKREIAALEIQQKELNKALKKAITDKDITAQKKYAAELTKVQTGLKKARGEFNQYAKEVNKGNEIFKRSGGLTKSLTTAFTSLGVQIISVYAAYRLLKTAVVGSIKTFAEFEKSLVNVQTLLKYNERTLERGALEILPKYGLAIKDVNRALFDAISAGIEATHSVEFLHEASRLAIGGVTDLRTAVDGMTSVMNTYSLSTEYAAEVSDAFYVAQKYGKTTVEKLVNQIGRVAPIAQIANVSFQEMLGSLASLTKGGLNTEESVTILRQVISALIKPAHQASLVLKDAAVPTGLLAIKTKGLVFALEQLNKAYRENPDAISGMIPNIRAFTGVAAFNEERLVELKKIIGEVETDTTSLTRAYDEQMATLQKRWDVAKSSVKAYKIMMGDYLSPVLKKVLKQFAQMADMSRTQISLTKEATIQLNREFDILLKANYTKEQLSLAIKSINGRYTKYLDNLIDEESSLEDIKRLQAEIILGLKGRIIYMRYEEDIKEAINDKIDATIRLQQIEDAYSRMKYGGYMQNIKLTAKEIAEMKKMIPAYSEVKMAFLEDIEDRQKGYDDLRKGQQTRLTQTLFYLKAYHQNIIGGEKETTEEIKERWRGVFTALGLDLDEYEKKLQEAEKARLAAMTGLGLIERQRREKLMLALTRKMQDEELAILEDGLNKRIIREHLNYERGITDLMGNILTKEKLGRELFEDEKKANEEIYAILEQMQEVHVFRMGQIQEQWFAEERERKDKETEKDKKDAIRAAKAIVSFKKKYGIDSAKELRDDEIAAFKIQSKELELSQEERERGLFNIKKKYLDDYINMAIDMSGDLANMIMNFEMERKGRQYDHEMELLKNAKDAESQILKNKLDKDLISEESYKAAQDALAEKHERKRIALEKKKFEQDKKHAIAQTIIAGSVAAMRVIAEYWGTSKAWIMAAAIGIKTLFEVGLISAQKYAMGGITDFKEGLLKGVGTWNSDNILGALSPGEIILNAKVGANPVLRSRASAINVAAGGVPFADGGMAARSVSAEVEQSFISANQIRTIVEAMPPQIVLVKDITTGIERVVRVEERANV